MAKSKKPARRKRSSARSSKASKGKGLKRRAAARPQPDPRYVQQVKLYEEGVKDFNEQRYARARQVFEKVKEGFNKELSDRAVVHIRICDQRLARQQSNPRSSEENYNSGIAMMNLGRWDEAREFLEKAKKQTPKAEFVFYALAVLDSLTGDADAALTNLKRSIELRPENRYHARNDEDFQFLLEDPRFTELLYPERDGSFG
jgi:tetratricopeptide (TPR) repeat protein